MYSYNDIYYNIHVNVNTISAYRAILLYDYTINKSSKVICKN